MRVKSGVKLRHFVTAAALLTSVASWSQSSAQSGVQSSAAAGPETGEPVEVQWQPADQVFVFPGRQAAASVLARNESQLSAELSAVIESIAVDVGQQVKAGQELARLNQTDLELTVNQARAQRDGLQARLNLAQDQLRKARKLKSGNFVSSDAVNQRQAEVVTLRADLSGADAQLAIAENSLAKAVIRAPYDAVVSVRQAQLGELTAPGSPLFSLVELGAEQVAVQVPASAARSLDAHMPDRFIFKGSDQLGQLRLLSMSPVITRASRTREARFEFIGKALAAGSEGQLQWNDAQPHLPPAAIVRRDGVLGVFTYVQDRAEFVPLPDAQEGRPAATIIAPDLPIITKGQERLQHGLPVTARPAPVAVKAG